MKRFLAFTAIAAFVAVVATACGSSKGGHCDAYGSVDHNTEQNADLASR